MSRIVFSAAPLVDGPTALRPWRDADLPPLVLACQDPEIPRWTQVPSPYGESDARLFLNQRHDAIASGTIAPLAIVSASDDTRLLGSIALIGIEWRYRRAEVGYWIAADARGQGHAKRALVLISRWAFEHAGLERIQLLLAAGNAASERVAQRAGYQREALLRSYIRGEDFLAYGLLSDRVREPAASPAS